MPNQWQLQHHQYNPVASQTTQTKLDKPNKLVICVGAFFVICIGAGNHFVYEAANCSIVLGVLVAVNECAWEHAKLMLVPSLFCWAFMDIASCSLSGANTVVSTATCMTIELCLMMAGFAACVALQISILPVHITLFIVCILLGFYGGYAVRCPHQPDVALLASVMVLCVHVVMLLLFTYVYVPSWAFAFRDERSCAEAAKFYGPPPVCRLTNCIG